MNMFQISDQTIILISQSRKGWDNLRLRKRLRIAVVRVCGGKFSGLALSRGQGNGHSNHSIPRAGDAGNQVARQRQSFPADHDFSFAKT
jgi:hypothetical protein